MNINMRNNTTKKTASDVAATIAVLIAAIIIASAVSEYGIMCYGLDGRAAGNMIQNKRGNKPAVVWNLATKGQYKFSGNPGLGTQYTNHRLKGKTSYTYTVKNQGRRLLTVKAKRKAKIYSSATVKPGKTRTVSFDIIDSETEFYMTFKGSKFTGNIR